MYHENPMYYDVPVNTFVTVVFLIIINNALWEEYFIDLSKYLLNKILPITKL